MATPQQPELKRSGKTPLQPDSIESDLEGRDQPRSGDKTGGPVPPENEPGHHPEHEQDKPDLQAFVSRFGQGRPEDDGGTADGSPDGDRERARPLVERVAYTTTGLVVETARAAVRLDVVTLARMPFRALRRYGDAVLGT